MAIGGPNGNNPSANLFIKNNSTTGVAQNNQTDQVSSVDNITSKSAANSSQRIAQLQNALCADGFSGTVDFNTLAKTAGASPIASSAIKGITPTSPLGKPLSSVTAIDGPVFGEIAAGGNSEIAFANQQLFRLAQLNQTDGLDKSDFQVSEESANLKKDNELLALVGNP
jgi:hypothetical protein